MSFFDKAKGPEFETRIKFGAIISQDFCTFKWPKCLPPSEHGGGNVAKDPDMVFIATPMGDNRFDLKAIGYGIMGSSEQIDGKYVSDYGNGSIYVFGLESLDPLDESIIETLKTIK